jgi:hypothetical protein
MSTDFPGSLDTLLNPSDTTAMNAAGYEHDVQHANLNDAVEALEAKVGVTSSDVNTSLDYLVKTASNPGHTHSTYVDITGYQLITGLKEFAITEVPVTDDATNYRNILYVTGHCGVNTGKTDSGYRQGIFLGMLTNYDGFTFAGTLANLNGIQINIGNYTGATGTVNECSGIRIRPYKNGIIANYYGLNLTAPVGAGVITNEYGVYSESASATNYFAGVVNLAKQLISTLAIGTAPFTVVSTTKVTNLNADMCDDLHASTLNVSGALGLSLGDGPCKVLGGGTIAHLSDAGYIHLPAGGSANQILKNSGTSGTGAWGGSVNLGSVSTDLVTCLGRLIVRTAASDPQHATPASRPAGTIKEIVYYNGKMYFCTNATTPTWEKITSA